ncbi:MAG: hypothetical protein Q9170_004069 [Blastenia crenularia]
MSARIPVVLCGRTEQIARSVTAGLQPEYEVIHVILSTAAGERKIPKLLRGAAPPPDDGHNIGTKNYSKPAAAVVLGRGYETSDISMMREACKDGRVPWLRPDLNKPAPPYGPEYGKAIIQRVKSRLDELKGGGNMDGDGVYFY